METPKRGTRFLHAKWLEPDKREPLVCVVTTVRRGAIYYKHEGGKKAFEYCREERWPAVCKQVLSTTDNQEKIE